MSQQYTKNFENCATCEFWGGNRSFLDRFCHRIVVDSSGVKGRCYNRDSGWFSKSDGTQACYRCRSYKRWALIRD